MITLPNTRAFGDRIIEVMCQVKEPEGDKPFLNITSNLVIKYLRKNLSKVDESILMKNSRFNKELMNCHEFVKIKE